MRQNDRTNMIIKWAVIAGDFVLLNMVIYAFCKLHADMATWKWGTQLRMFVIISNLALLASEGKFHSHIHERVVSAGDVVRNVMLLTMVQAAIAYIVMRHMMYWMASGRVLLQIGTVLFVSLLVLRLIERNAIKRLRRVGRNSRTVTMVGADSELRRLYDELLQDPTMGYRVQGYYADEKLEDGRVEWLGTIKQLLDGIKNRDVILGDEVYACLSRKESDTIRLLSKECDRQVTRFYFVPVSVESIGLRFKREYINDIEVFTTHETPLQNQANRLLKRGFDVVLATLFLIPTALIYPIVWLMIKIQSPGPILFKQERTGMNGENFTMLKFRSMHVNKDADRLQATKNDPRKFKFGNFMRKTNIDELPQFWNVLRGDMSIVGPRPHMLAHTEMYSKLIDKYMVRHFLKPGITGWAQVTGYRGETRELWQMEGRVQRDIWYMEHWTPWLDLRIIWLTIKTIFIPDKNAY